MSWTYSGNPAASPADALRFRIGDTNVNDPLFSDGEVAYLLAQANNDPNQAAIAAVNNLLAKYSGLIDESVGSVSKSWSKRLDNWYKLLDTLRANLVYSGAVVPYAGGISKTDVRNRVLNPDRVKPLYTRDEDHDPRTRDGLSDEDLLSGLHQ